MLRFAAFLMFAPCAGAASGALMPVEPAPTEHVSPLAVEPLEIAGGPILTVLPPPPPPEPAPEAEGEVIGAGQASYYGDELAGNRTASGERFDPEALTAAHRTLPLGSRIRVVNERTGASVIVRVNDRGPFADDRVLDVSKGAAREIGMIRRGTARVRMELLPKKRG